MRVAGVLTATYGDTLAVVRSPSVSSLLLRLKAHPLHAGAQLIAKSNHGFLATHEGVDVGGERLGKEVQHARPPLRTLPNAASSCPSTCAPQVMEFAKKMTACHKGGDKKLRFSIIGATDRCSLSAGFGASL